MGEEDQDQWNTATTGQQRSSSSSSNNSWQGGPGGGGSSGNAEQDEKENKALDNLATIANYNANALKGKQRQGYEAYDISDQQAQRLADAQAEQNKRNIGDDWFTQMKKLQGTANQLKGTAGDSMSGSNWLQFVELLNRAKDDIDTESLSTQRQNQDTINNDLFESLSASVNSRNELAADTEYGLRNIIADWAAQSSSISPEKAQERGIFGEKGEGDVGTLNNPSWLNPDGFFDSIKVGPAEITKQGWYREDNAAEKAQDKIGKPTANAAAANGDYWNSLFNGYNKRY